ncbi:unnamed protein product, partial [Larinioides sclopetarius]
GKHSTSHGHSIIGDVEAGSFLSRCRSSCAGGFPWYIDLMFFLFGFATTVFLLLVESMGGFSYNPKNVTLDGNFTTTESVILFNVTTLLPLLE